MRKRRAIARLIAERFERRHLHLIGWDSEYWIAVVNTERDVAQVSFAEGTAAFAETMRANVPNGHTPFRRAYIWVIDEG
jgi:hypothetical protein